MVILWQETWGRGIVHIDLPIQFAYIFTCDLFVKLGFLDLAKTKRRALRNWFQEFTAKRLQSVFAERNSSEVSPPPSKGRTLSFFLENLTAAPPAFFRWYRSEMTFFIKLLDLVPWRSINLLTFSSYTTITGPLSEVSIMLQEQTSLQISARSNRKKRGNDWGPSDWKEAINNRKSDDLRQRNQYPLDNTEQNHPESRRINQYNFELSHIYNSPLSAHASRACASLSSSSVSQCATSFQIRIRQMSATTRGTRAHDSWKRDWSTRTLPTFLSQKPWLRTVQSRLADGQNFSSRRCYCRHTKPKPFAALPV